MIEWIWSKKDEKLLKSQKIIKEKKKKTPPPSTKIHKINGFINENKREETSERMSKREWVANIGINPFHNKQNYVKDISVQDAFLRPQNSNFNLEK